MTGRDGFRLGDGSDAEDAEDAGATLVWASPTGELPAGPGADPAADRPAELDLAALGSELDVERARWQLAIEAASIGTYDWDLVTGTLTWDDRLLELFGYDDAEFTRTIEAFNARVHPDDLPRVTQQLQQAIATCGEFGSQYRVLLPDGGTRWVQARGRVLCDHHGRAVRLLGAAYDTTAVRESDARVARILESMPAAFFSVDRDWRLTYVNARAERLLGRTRAELIGSELWELFPDAVGSAFETEYRRAMGSGEPSSFEAYYPAPLEAWYEVRAWPDPDGLSVYFHDITVRRRAQAEAHRAAQLAGLLAGVASELSSTLDVEDAVARLAQLVVPVLGSWSIVTVVDDGPGPEWTRLRDIGWAHADPAKRELVHDYTVRRLTVLTEESFLARALRSAEPVLVREGALEVIAGLLPPGPARDTFLQLGSDSVAVLPLRAHGRILGVLSVYGLRQEADAVDLDLDIARDLSTRAALALENARLYGEQRRLAEDLQRALLTEPPNPDPLELAVRYLPAAELAQVGGDWYDAFVQPSGATVLVIGDVVGHDSQAAAAMGQLRGLLRGIAATTGEGPAAVLARLDDVIETLDVRTTATAVLARLEQSPAERAQGLRTLRWSNAGHPPPIAVLPGGEVQVLGDVADGDADLLLGIDARFPRRDHVVQLPAGSTVLLYTDGLVERRGQSIDDGLLSLGSALARHAHLPLPQMCDAVLADLLPPQAADDVAITAVRLHPED